MPEINNTEENGTKNYSTLTALLYAAVSCTAVFSSVSGIFASSTKTVLGTGIVFPFLIMLLYYLYLHALGEKANSGALLIIVPALLCPILGYMSNDWISALYAVLGVLSPTLAATMVYLASIRSKQRSAACASASFLMLLFTMLETILPLYILSLTHKISMKTILFDTIDTYIENVKSIYFDAMNTASSLIGTEQIQLSAADTEYFENTLMTTIALSPAILCAVYFFSVFIFTKIADPVAVKLGITKERAFGKYEVSGTANTVFNITVTVIMLSILFSSGMSSFTCGVLSVLIVVLPNYLILGTRRIFGKLQRVVSTGVATIIIAVIFAVGFAISYYLLLLILSFFGTSEYRMCKYEANRE